MTSSRDRLDTIRSLHRRETVQHQGVDLGICSHCWDLAAEGRPDDATLIFTSVAAWPCPTARAAGAST